MALERSVVFAAEHIPGISIAVDAVHHAVQSVREMRPNSSDHLRADKFAIIDEVGDSILNPFDKEQFYKAAMMGVTFTGDQLRQSKELYIFHLFGTLEKLYSINKQLSPDLYTVAFLHDLVEDHAPKLVRAYFQKYKHEIADTESMSDEELERIALLYIEKEFNPTVALYVATVTKLKGEDVVTPGGYNDHRPAFKLLNALSDTEASGALLIKFADRMHNMETLEGYKGKLSKGKWITKEERQKAKAQETIFYVELAYILGLDKVYEELGDVCLRYISPDFYAVADRVLASRSDSNVIRDNFGVILKALHNKGDLVGKRSWSLDVRLPTKWDLFLRWNRTPDISLAELVSPEIYLAVDTMAQVQEVRDVFRRYFDIEEDQQQYRPLKFIGGENVRDLRNDWMCLGNNMKGVCVKVFDRTMSTRFNVPFDQMHEQFPSWKALVSHSYMVDFYDTYLQSLSHLDAPDLFDTFYEEGSDGRISVQIPWERSENIEPSRRLKDLLLHGKGNQRNQRVITREGSTVFEALYRAGVSDFRTIIGVKINGAPVVYPLESYVPNNAYVEIVRGLDESIFKPTFALYNRVRMTHAKRFLRRKIKEASDLDGDYKEYYLQNAENYFYDTHPVY